MKFINRFEAFYRHRKCLPGMQAFRCTVRPFEASEGMELASKHPLSVRIKCGKDNTVKSQKCSNDSFL